VRDRAGGPDLIAGHDVGFEDQGRGGGPELGRSAARRVRAGAALALCANNQTWRRYRRTAFPYVPGLLSFRETRAVLERALGRRTPAMLGAACGPDRLGRAAVRKGRVGVAPAVPLTLARAGRYLLPEPSRVADQFASSR
jgi:deoxyinosine 3'endonuclease (endonuclease V)